MHRYSLVLMHAICRHSTSCTSASNISYPMPLSVIDAQSLDILYAFLIATLAILDTYQPMRYSTSNSDQWPDD